MPSRLNTPVLTVDVNLIRKVDTRNVENLFSMWTVFSRCAGSLEEGRRLENLSWRIWNRETFCCESTENQTEKAAVPTDIPQSRSDADMPSLSGSVDSLVDDDTIEEFDAQAAASTSAPLDIARPLIKRTDSSSSQGRGRERHITPDDLEKMVLTIKETKQLEPLPHSKHPYLCTKSQEGKMVEELIENTISATNTTPSTLASDSVSTKSSLTAVSDSSSATSERSTTSVVRGFSPSHISSSFRRNPLPMVKEPSPISSLTTIPETTTTQAKKSIFALGGSSQSDTESFVQSLSSMEQPKQLSKKKTHFTLGGSSNEDESSFPKTLHPGRSSLTEALGRAKQTSFREDIPPQPVQDESAAISDVFEDTEDEDDVDESAIDDDEDDSEWEDSPENSGKSSIDDKTFFQRVDSRPNLASRRSLITTMLHQNERANAMAAIASQANGLQRLQKTSPNGPSLAASPESDDGMPLMMKKGSKSMHEIPRTAAQPIRVAPQAIPHQTALSPKTTRRNMLNSELTQSLRRHMLWERQYLNAASAQLQRRHTSHDVANLKQYPEKVNLGNDDKDTAGSYNQYFGMNLGGYHSKGW